MKYKSIITSVLPSKIRIAVAPSIKDKINQTKLTNTFIDGVTSD